MNLLIVSSTKIEEVEHFKKYVGDAGALARGQIESVERAVLRLAVDELRPRGVEECLEPVAAADREPVTRAHADPVLAARRSRDRAVVLGAARDAVERSR